ncbi:MAG: hypothetical protein HWE21_02115 [Cytophagia bacterium]|nr:hypothetical protein [Cytophagia bacterium]
MRRLTLLLSLFISVTFFAQAQQEDPRRYIDSAVHYMDLAQYSQADEYFMTALDKIDVLSADFCFYFGKNSFYLNKFSQSIDWLNKYLELKGSRGQFSKETLEILEKAEEAFRNNRGTTGSADVNAKFFYLNTISCDENELITCPVCKGDDVITKRDRFGEMLYKTCPYSTNGVLTCTEFNLLIQGNLKPKNK